MYGLLDWANLSGGPLLVALAVIVGGLVTWRLLSRARNAVAETPDDQMQKPTKKSSTVDSRGSTAAGGKRKKRRRASGGAGQQPRSQHKKRNRGKGKDSKDREKDSGTQESSTSSDSDRLRQDTDRHEVASEKERDGNGGCSRPLDEVQERQVTCCDRPSDTSRHEQDLLSDMVKLDRSVVCADEDGDQRSVSVGEPVDHSTATIDTNTNTLIMSTIGFVDNHFKQEEEEEELIDVTQQEEEDQKQLLEYPVSDNIEQAMLKSALTEEEDKAYEQVIAPTTPKTQEEAETNPSDTASVTKEKLEEVEEEEIKDVTEEQDEEESEEEIELPSDKEDEDGWVVL